uniref:Angiotensin-converting enzyme n=1 Tax=Macrostomum lignano TaxID=282301 RepID=A0A1I8H3J4_9PLAT
SFQRAMQSYLTPEQRQFYADNGYLVIDSFLSPEQCEELRKECHQLTATFNLDEHRTIFDAKNRDNEAEQSYRSQQYFFDSWNKVAFFFEKDAFNDNGELTAPRNQCINKLGHYLHVECPGFRRVTFDPRAQAISRDLGFQVPRICQSMYIFKQPRIGGCVDSHQDATFLYVPCEVKRGSLVLIDGFVLHRSNENRSQKSRDCYTWHVIDLPPGISWSAENWMNPPDRAMQSYLTPEQRQFYADNGYLVIDSFLSPEQCEELRKECHQLTATFNLDEHRTIFDAKNRDNEAEQSYRSQQYFFDSWNKVAFFFEKDAFNDKGELTAPRNQCINKLGHYLHVECPGFRRVTFDPRAQAISRDLGFQVPRICQSMYIFKQPRIGGCVDSHQDATFLYVPCEVKRGSLVLIDGFVLHMSKENRSQKSRDSYTWHVIDLPLAPAESLSSSSHNPSAPHPTAPQSGPLFLDEALLQRLARAEELRAVLLSACCPVMSGDVAMPSVQRLLSATIQACAVQLPAQMVRREDGLAGSVTQTVNLESGHQIDGVVVLCDCDSGRVLTVAPLPPLLRQFEAACLDGLMRRFAKTSPFRVASFGGYVVHNSEGQLSVELSDNLASADVAVCRGVEAIRQALSAPGSDHPRCWMVFLADSEQRSAVADLPALSKAAVVEAASLFHDADGELFDGPVVAVIEPPSASVCLALCKYAMEKFLSTEGRSVRTLAAVLLLALLPTVARCLSTNETEARLWFTEFDAKLAVEKNKVVEASWANAVNLTKENAQKVVEANLAHTEFLREQRAEMRQRFDWKQFSDRNLTRLFDKADDIGTSAANASMQERYGQLSTQMSGIYSTAQVPHPDTGKMMQLDPDITDALADPNESERVKRALWQGWRDASGKRMRQNYTDFVTMGNLMIREAGYSNIAQYWQSWYEPRPGQNFTDMMAKLWDVALPFYQQLHAYVRRKLRDKYGAELFPETGHIPAHLLGNMWAQSWFN